jgi:hypothetical protein
LDGVRPGLSSRLTAAHVPVDLSVGHADEPHPGDDNFRVFSSLSPDDDCCKHVMCRVRQEPEHPIGIGIILWFAEDPAIDHNLRVCGNYDR